MKGKYELIYTGGGIYIAQYEKDGYAWCVENDVPCCFTQFKIPADRDELYMDENVVWSIDVNEGMTQEDERIYNRLYSMLANEGAIHEEVGKSYYLLKDDSSGEPYEMLQFNQKINKKDVQDLIYEHKYYFEDHMNESGFYQEMYELEYVLYKLQEEYDVDIIPWDNSYNLYV